MKYKYKVVYEYPFEGEWMWELKRQITEHSTYIGARIKMLGLWFTIHPLGRAWVEREESKNAKT